MTQGDFEHDPTEGCQVQQNSRSTASSPVLHKKSYIQIILRYRIFVDYWLLRFLNSEKELIS